jgi:hypothetical protein
MVIELSRYFGIDAAELDKRGVLNAYIGIDNRLFVDPNLLSRIKIPEFDGARQELTEYFANVIKLLRAAKLKGDIAWTEAEKRVPESSQATILASA